MANEHSGILDANALFGDLPGLMGPACPPVVFLSASPPSDCRRDVTTTARQRPRPQVDPVRARLIAVISCGTVALAFALGACFLYVTTPTPAPHARAMSAAR